MNLAEKYEESAPEKLWELYKSDKSIESRNEIVLQYIWLVRKIVLRFKGSYSNSGSS